MQSFCDFLGQKRTRTQARLTGLCWSWTYNVYIIFDKIIVLQSPIVLKNKSYNYFTVSEILVPVRTVPKIFEII